MKFTSGVKFYEPQQRYVQMMFNVFNFFVCSTEKLIHISYEYQILKYKIFKYQLKNKNIIL